MPLRPPMFRFLDPRCKTAVNSPLAINGPGVVEMYHQLLAVLPGLPRAEGAAVLGFRPRASKHISSFCRRSVPFPIL